MTVTVSRWHLFSHEEPATTPLLLPIRMQIGVPHCPVEGEWELKRKISRGGKTVEKSNGGRRHLSGVWRLNHLKAPGCDLGLVIART